MNALTTAIQNARQSLDNYQGGTISSLKVKTSVQAAKSAAQKARQNLAQQDEPFNDDEAEQYYQAYQAMCPELVDTVKVAQDKVLCSGRFQLHRFDMLISFLCRRLYSKTLDWRHPRGRPLIHSGMSRTSSGRKPRSTSLRTSMPGQFLVRIKSGRRLMTMTMLCL
ncbi:hypothetical protein ASPNIDRAFT_188455, partial [Aspergillus niger ATCC 1015]